MPIGGLVERITCDGCRKEYHLNCVQMNQYQMRVFIDFKNALWLCDDCLSVFRKNVTTNNGPNVQRNQETKQKLNIENTVSQLQSDVASLRQCLTELQVSCASGFQRTDNSIVMSSTPQANLNQREILSPILNESTELQMGSRAKPKSSGDRKYWVFFTRIAKHVSVDAMREMVSNALQTHGPPDVVKLVPRWSNYENLRYISFKIGVDWMHKEKAKMQSTWPTGLLFREFVSRESDYWEP